MTYHERALQDELDMLGRENRKYRADNEKLAATVRSLRSEVDTLRKALASANNRATKAAMEFLHTHDVKLGPITPAHPGAPSSTTEPDQA